MSDYEKAQLIFLDAIERRQAEVRELLKSRPVLPDDVKAVLESIRQAVIEGSEKTLELLKEPKEGPDNDDSKQFDVVVEALLRVANTITISINKILTQMERDKETVISELKYRPRKWKFTIDRNFDTKMIQSVIAEVVE